MRLIRPLTIAAAVLLLAALTIEPGVARTLPRASSGEAGEVRDVRAFIEAGEVRRIRAHFDSVLADLEARDLQALTSEQRARRASLVDTLRVYRDRGVFPHNYDFPGRAMPYFVDRKSNVLCAVAYLLASTGRRDIVDRVARVDNNVWVSQLAADVPFSRWLDANGLTLAEAARIQVPYVMTPETPAQRAQNRAFLVAAPIALGGSAVASLWNGRHNADGHQRVANVLGLASGTMAIGMGAMLVGRSDTPRGVGVASAALGGLSVALATRGIRRHGASLARAREAERLSSTLETSLAPIVPMGGGTGAGVALSLRF